MRSIVVLGFDSGHRLRHKTSPIFEKFLRDARSASLGGMGLNSIRRFFNNWCEPEILRAEDFLSYSEGESALSPTITESFIHSRIGSSQAIAPLLRSAIFSSNDFLRERSSSFSLRYASRSISWSRYAVRRR